MERVLRMSAHPFHDLLCLVRAAVVEYDMDVFMVFAVPRPPVDQIEEGDEFRRPVARGRVPDDPARHDVEGRVEVGRAVPHVVVRVPFHLPRAELEERLRVVESLYLGLLVH